MTNPDTQPWEPSELALRVGDRVEVRLSGECPGYLNTYGDRICQHTAHHDRRTATIIAFWWEPTHPYHVRFPGLMYAGVFSRSELRLRKRAPR